MRCNITAVLKFEIEGGKEIIYTQKVPYSKSWIHDTNLQRKGIKLDPLW